MNTRLSAKPQATTWGAGYEPRDAQVGWLFGVLLFMALGAVTIHLVLAGFVNSLKEKPARRDQWSDSSRGAVETSMTKNVPRLQISPARDLKNFRAHEDAQLESFGWVNKNAGVVRLPISQAMDLALQKGFPVRDNSNAAAVGPGSLRLQQERAK